MEHYVTLFDGLFLPQGLALHASMERHLGKYTLWILCVDDEAFEALNKLNLPNVSLLSVDEFETDELKRVKPGRTRAEYCWTLTPHVPGFVFDCEPSAQRVTYLDADLHFRKNPGPIFNELEASGKSVLITEHAYAPEHEQSETSGKYCVQFMTFYRDQGDSVRKWWEERCIEWCFARFEAGKFGDQKYLDDWPERFPEQVHVLDNKELALAPWNATRYPFANGIFWHFHGLRIARGLSKYIVLYGRYPLPGNTCKYVYKPYTDDLRAAISLLEEQGIAVRPQQKYSRVGVFIGFLGGIYRQLWRINLSRKEWL